ncbi:MAG: tRNA 2-thiouridine(34) synthase MnmA [Candidatus Omnitrophota bacterium]
MKKVVVAMSGGVDSSVAAFLLKREGYDVTGITMKLWDTQCAADARKTASALGIDHHVVDLRKAFRRDVVGYFCSEYLHGRTPNPCIMCNNRIKFGILLDKAKSLGARLLATGHYVRLYRPLNGRYRIREGVDKFKDQSYFLFALRQRQLARLLFPLGKYTKGEVRDVAAKAGLILPGHTRESQDICFLAGGDYRRFLKRECKGIKPGRVKDLSGQCLGSHKGTAFYTIGQRQGLGIAAGKPLYVVKLDAAKNEVVLATAEDLKARELTVTDVSWMGIGNPGKPFRALAKIRYNHKKSPCRIIPLSPRKVKAIFDSPQHAITPGQAFVFYRGQDVAGGGWIS